MNTKMRVFLSIGILAVLLVVFYLITGGVTKHTGYMVVDVDDKFEECLKEKNIKFFINSKDGSFGKMRVVDYLDNVEIVNCFNNKKVCEVLGVDSFPFWMIGDNEIKGDISVEELSKFSGCSLK